MSGASSLPYPRAPSRVLLVVLVVFVLFVVVPQSHIHCGNLGVLVTVAAQSVAHCNYFSKYINYKIKFE